LIYGGGGRLLRQDFLKKAPSEALFYYPLVILCQIAEGFMRSVLAVVMAIASYSVMAGPAPYFKWGHAQDNLQICSQISPGEGWTIRKGPFKDARCTQPGMLG
jgi:hypothetical protein